MLSPALFSKRFSLKNRGTLTLHLITTSRQSAGLTCSDMIHSVTGGVGLHCSLAVPWLYTALIEGFILIVMSTIKLNSSTVEDVVSTIALQASGHCSKH